MSLIRGDAIAIPLRDDSVDLVVTSPPYFALRSYTDGGEHYDGQIGSEPTPQAFLEALWAVTAECRRVLKPSGSMWVNLGDKYAGTQPGSRKHTHPRNNGTDANWKRAAPLAAIQAEAPTVAFGGVPSKSLMGLPWRYAIGCIDQLDLILRAEVIWSKPSGLPESVTDRVRRSHEQWFMFTKEPRYFAAVDEVREPHITGDALTRVRSSNYRHAGRQVSPTGTSGNPLGKLPGSVWTIPSEPLKVPDWLGVDHFAAFPQEWPRRIILGWSPSGICVECGQGRRPVVAKEAAPDLAWREVQGRKRDGTNGLGGSTLGVPALDRATRVTGYACACPEPTAPTRPAVVLDPFGGTGTVAMVARALGRYPVHIDLSADYLKLARWRIYESGHASKTAERTNRERQGVLL